MIIENNIQSFAKAVDIIRKRFDALKINYVTIGQFAAKRILIFAPEKEFKRIRAFLLEDELKVVELSKTVSTLDD